MSASTKPTISPRADLPPPFRAAAIERVATGTTRHPRARAISAVRAAGAMTDFGYDDAGQVVASGWIDLDIAPVTRSLQPETFSGTWKLEALADPSSIGPQNGSGVLSGSVVGGAVVVDLHPDQ